MKNAKFFRVLMAAGARRHAVPAFSPAPFANGDEFDFHGMEKRPNLGSMPWKTAEFDFHAVEAGGKKV